MNPAGVYVQDQISLNKWTINAGLRFDYLNSSYPDFDVAPRRYVPVAEHFEGADVLSWKDLSPRIAISYDPFGTGKTALKVAASRYVMQERLTQSTALVVPTRASVSQISRTWTDRNGDYVVDGDPLNPALNGELGPSPNANFGKQVTNFRLDPDWANGFGARPYNWEFMGALQTELASSVSLQAGYYRRIFGNFIVTDNLLTSPADYDPFCITVPTDARLPGGGGGQMCGLYDLNPSKVGLVDTIQTSSSNYGKQTGTLQRRGRDDQRTSAERRLDPGRLQHGQDHDRHLRCHRQVGQSEPDAATHERRGRPRATDTGPAVSQGRGLAAAGEDARFAPAAVGVPRQRRPTRRWCSIRLPTARATWGSSPTTSRPTRSSRRRSAALSPVRPT